jgi:hypothetical protein
MPNQTCCLCHVWARQVQAVCSRFQQTHVKGSRLARACLCGHHNAVLNGRSALIPVGEQNLLSFLCLTYAVPGFAARWVTCGGGPGFTVLLQWYRPRVCSLHASRSHHKYVSGSTLGPRPFLPRFPPPSYCPHRISCACERGAQLALRWSRLLYLELPVQVLASQHYLRRLL